MNFNASIVDQRIVGIVDEHANLLSNGTDNDRKKAEAFVLLCVSTCLEMSLDEAAELLTEGGNDAGVDGIYVGDPEDGEFLVTLFQGKYKIKDLTGEANFPANGVEKAVNTAQVLFDPYRNVILNEKIKPKIEEVRSLIREGYIPKLKFVLCNNGAKWNNQAQLWIEEAEKDYGGQISFVHFNHDSIVSILQSAKKVDATITLSGQVIEEAMNFMRVMVGRVSVHEVYQLFEQHGDKLLERNVRRYLGLYNNHVNTAIHKTLCEANQADKFYFYNNGITVVCDTFNYNAFQKSDYKVQLKNMQVINGGQTCKTIQETLKTTPNIAIDAYVMIRIYQLADANKEFVRAITYATNSQNAVGLRDLHSNDEIQKQLEIGFKDLGYTYKRQREEGGAGSSVITSLVVAEAVLAIWRKKPHQAKFRRSEHFGLLYDTIFKDLNAVQALLAVFIFRAVENERKKPSNENPPIFLPYASHYIAMLIGQKLLEDSQLKLNVVSHRNFVALQDRFKTSQMAYHQAAVSEIESALKNCYGDRVVSLQQLSATFRRGDLLEMFGYL
jgi:hypothetical protein